MTREVGPSTLSGDALPEDHLIARRLAVEAGELLLQIRSKIGSELSPSEGKDLGDQSSHEFLVEELASLRPGDAVLSEEGVDDAKRLGADRVWIVDPLDGTREFGEPPRSDWAVHVALTISGRVAAGAVALPGRDLVLATPKPPMLDGALAARPRIVISRSRPPGEAGLLAEGLGGEVMTLGSAGAKAMAVVLGDAEIYVHSGGQYEWDSAAPVAVALAAGLHASRIDGRPIVYNQPDPWLPDLLICRAELAQQALQIIASHAS